VSNAWIAAYAVLWLTVLVVTFTMVGIVRRITSVLEVLERRLATPPDMGAEIGSTVSPFELVDADGQTVGFEELVQEPTIMLVSANGCPACRKLLDQLDGVGDSIDGVPFVVVTNADDAETHYPPGVRVLYEPELAASTALDNHVNPQAYILDPTGLVLDRRVAGSLSDFQAMAREQRRRATNGAGAAADSEKVAQSA
jgi:thiol-disulfide isomerase/thioredoxin